MSDTGIGIASEDIDELFEEFAQAETSTTRRFGGTGLGLSICAHLTDMMGGTISVDSTVGQGSRFSVRLPILENPDPSKQPDPHDQLEGLRVLVTAKTSDVRKIQETYLRYWGAEVTTATDPYEATVAASEAVKEGRNFDVTVIGVNFFPEEITKITDSIRTASKGTKFVLCTLDRHGGTLALGDIVELSVDPMRRANLIAAVAVAAGRESPEVAELETIADQVGIAPPDVEDARASGDLVLVAEDNLTNQVVILRQLNRLGLAAEIAENGAEALVMWRKNSYAAVLSDVHMPEMDGFQLTAEIRKEDEDRGTHSTVIAVTANVLEGEANRCLDAGMDDYLGKPVELDKLRRTLAKWISLPKASPSDRALEESTDISGEGPVDRGELMRLLGVDDDEYIQKMLESFWSTMVDVPEYLFRRIQEKNSVDLREKAHWAKGAAASAAAVDLAAFLQSLENSALAEDWVAIENLSAHIDQKFGDLKRYILGA
ncbi:MAG: response regulator [Alphaproteobacteria bacterium]|nr:response regulator [Alphaproteobacteria bacterium]MBT5861218.1 response regulator [Alphaproteobacteria bacterium]